MALQLNTTLDTGVTGNYWKIIEVYFNDYSSQSYISVGLYLSADARNTNKNPLLVKQYNWNIGDYPFSVTAMTANNPLAISYSKLKTLPEFTGAIDV